MPHASVPVTCCLTSRAMVLLGSRPPPVPVSSAHAVIARHVSSNERPHPYPRVGCTRHQGRPRSLWCWAVLGLPATWKNVVGAWGALRGASAPLP